MWELLIDNAFGIIDRNKYFPKAIWKKLDNSNVEYVSLTLKPDTIMKISNDESYDLFVLDSKYYGLYDDGTNRLPATADVNK